MRIELHRDEAELLLRILRASDPERQREIHRAEASEFRHRLERDARRVQEIQERIERALAGSDDVELQLDESIEESFPASDPPARSSPEDRPPPVEG